MDHLIEVEEIESVLIKDLPDYLLKKQGLRLSKMTVSDLVFHNGKAIRHGNGVYVFRENQRPVYVGNCVARNFVERIPAHFDVRENGWFNSLLLSRIQEKEGRRAKEDKTDENLEEAARYAFDNYNLLLINFSTHDKDAMSRLELLMRLILNPINKFKRKRLPEEKYSISIGEYIYIN
jgi:hypothetical protein